MEQQHVNYQTRIDISKKILNQGFANDVYFLLTMDTSMFGNKTNYDLLIQSVEQQISPNMPSH